MKRITFLFLLILTGFVSAHGQECVWAKQSTGDRDNFPVTVVTDAPGNVYVMGRFSSLAVTFGAFTLNNTDSSSTNILLVKYSSTGAVLWAKSFGDSIDDEAYGLAIDGSGNLYLAGNFSSSSVTFGATTLTNVGGYDIFLTKVDNNGNVLWAKSAACGPGGNTVNQITGIASDASGHIVIAGYFDNSVTFGSFHLVSAGYTNVFVAKYDTSGNVIWAKCSSGGGGYLSSALTVDGTGNIFLTGNCSGTPTSFDTITITPVTGSNQMFLVKFNSSGDALWARTAGDTCLADPRGVVADAAGDIYVAGSYDCAFLMFGATILTNASGGSDDIFLVKYNSSGTVLWAKSVGGTSDDEAQGITTDASANIYMTGMFTSPSIAFGTTALTNFGVFVSKFNASGNAIWAKDGASFNSGSGNSIVRDGVGNLYVTGGFNGIPLVLDATALTPGSLGFLDAFTAKFIDASEDVQAIGKNENDILLYPNPTQNTLTLTSSTTITSINITNFLGQTVHTQNYNADKVQIDVADLQTGVYFIKINGTEVKKFVKE